MATYFTFRIITSDNHEILETWAVAVTLCDTKKLSVFVLTSLLPLTFPIHQTEVHVKQSNTCLSSKNFLFFLVPARLVSILLASPAFNIVPSSSYSFFVQQVQLFSIFHLSHLLRPFRKCHKLWQRQRNLVCVDDDIKHWRQGWSPMSASLHVTIYMGMLLPSCQLASFVSNVSIVRVFFLTQSKSKLGGAWK
jgi:hypothetical protein